MKIKQFRKVWKDDIAFFRIVFMKSFCLFGMVLFSVAVSFQDLIIAFQPSLIAGFLYLFTEMYKYYKIEPKKRVLTKSINKKYFFII